MISYSKTTNRLFVRDINENDFDNIKRVYSDSTVTKFLSNNIFSDEEITARLDEMILYKKLNLQLSIGIIEKNSNAFIGFFRIDFYPSVEYLRNNGGGIIGYVDDISIWGHIQSAYLIKDFQRKGYMTEVFHSLKDFLNNKKIKYLFGSIHKQNIEAQNLLKNFNFDFHGTIPSGLNHLGFPLKFNNFPEEEYFVTGFVDQL
jgi:RimJ/RimL family protein N-acetyltransferase